MGDLRVQLVALRKLAPLLIDRRAVLAYHVALTLVYVVVATAVPFVTQFVVTEVRADGVGGTASRYLLPGIGVGLILQACGVVQDYTAAVAGTRTRSRLQDALFSRLVRAPVEDVLSRSPAYWQARMNRDVGRAMVFLPYSLLPFVQQILVALFYLGLVVYLSWQLTAVALLALPLTLLPQLWLNRLRKTERRVSEEVGLASSTTIADVLRAIPMVKLSGAEAREIARLDARRQFLMKLNIAMERRRTIVRLVSRWSLAALPIAVLSAGYALFSNDVLPAEDLAAYLVCLGGITSAVTAVARRGDSFPLGIEAAQRLVEILELPTEAAPARGAASASSDDGSVVASLDDGHRLAQIESIVFEDVHFSYKVRDDGVNGPLRDDAADVPLVPVLRGVSFELRVGEPTALVGGSGAGKSTIVSLICGFARPTSGRILVNGVDLRELPAEEYRSRIAAVLHQDFVLSRSFEENLAYRDPAETRDAEIEAVARQLDLNEVRERDLRKRERSREKVSADEFWSKLGLPADLLAEGALQLSAGERQRVAIARQLLHESHVWILDEATANLDGRSEDLVFEQLAHIEPLLLLTVSHRLSCVRRMQRVLVLAEGRIVACGTHDELIANDPTYQALFGPQIHDPAWSVATSGEERAR